MGYTIGIVDDHPLFREGIKAIILNNEKVAEVLTFCDGDDVIRFLKGGGKVDVLFMDIIMPVRDGLYTTQFIKQYYPGIKVLALSSVDRVDYIEKMVDAGVDGYVLKECNVNELTQAMEAVLSNNNYFSSKIIVALSENTKMRFQQKVEPSVVSVLSQRELEVFRHLCNGLNRGEIASILFISEKTVDKHKENIFKKTGCKNLVHLVVTGIKQGVLKVEELETSL
nr:response regulator transcription factor [uncultured Carboxylicivirga sp.]